MKRAYWLPIGAALLGVLLTGPVVGQSIGQIRKPLDKATGGATAAPPKAGAAAASANAANAAAANSKAQAAAADAQYQKRNAAAQVGADQRVIDFLRQRIEDGSADAPYDLAKRYEEGKGVEADPVEARKLYKLSAKRGNEDAKKWLEEHPKDPKEEEAEEAAAKAEEEAKTKPGDAASAEKTEKADKPDKTQPAEKKDP